MINQKYTGMKILLTAGYWCTVLSMAAIPSTIPQQLLPLNSLMLGTISIAVTLGDNPNYSVVSTNGILSVTPKVLL
jgi:hypothetical protein